MEYLSSTIKNNYLLYNEEEIIKFLNKVPEVNSFLLNNITNFKRILDCPITLKYNNEKVCKCDDAEELLFILFENGGFDQDLEEQLFDEIISPNWYTIGEYVMVAVK
jgi:hypothetical protein